MTDEAYSVSFKRFSRFFIICLLSSSSLVAPLLDDFSKVGIHPKKNAHENPSIKWESITIPQSSYFAGFDPPSDVAKWNQAREQATKGELVLLLKFLDVIRNPVDLIEREKHFKWIHNLCDFYKSKASRWTELTNVNRRKAAIVSLGYRNFSDRGGYFSVISKVLLAAHQMITFVLATKSIVDDYSSLNPAEIIVKIKTGFRLPIPVVAIGYMDENWGWASTYTLNR